MRVAALMSAPAVVVGPESLLEDVARMLRIREISALPVVDGERRLVGLVSEADVLAAETSRQAAWATTSAQDVMTRDVVAVRSDADVREVAGLMSRRGLRHVPVLEDGHVVGMLSRRDLIGMLDLSDADIKAAIDAVLDEELGPGRPRVTVRRGRVLVDLPEEAPAYRLVKSLAAGVPGVLAVGTRS